MSIAKNSIKEILKRMDITMVKRNPDRLYTFYEDLLAIHRNHYPDRRFGQFVFAFFQWLQEEKEIDPFYVEEADMLDCLHEYVKKEQ